ncbi:universal stress protein [Phytohabitans sp. ZYX-F-186]|uniref:Universal stress protein n=1 Tax=Phytohabitans maris TaxID=3071409 RepID=A0ABU0ZH25_9ACTN|nr:universal stress protein [Phytohabitans sp. ZYX-F-186]MDQ7906358.1 universal stress protein [Phytohabitans sp. ZYX-F-186]
MASTDAPVAVGVKDLMTDMAAVSVAAAEAAATGRPLHVVHAFMWPLELPPGDDGTEREQAERIVADAAERARERHRGLDVAPEVVDGDVIEVLLRTAAHASMLVIGSDDPGGPADPSASVSFQVAARAAGPVLCVRGSGSDGGPVVVGVDGSPDAAVGLAIAVEEARRRQAPLVVLHAEGAACAETHEAGDLKVEHRRAEGPAGQVLVAASQDAQLVVVGAQGDRPTPLGPVTQTVLRHADCPVLVARKRHVPAQARIASSLRRPASRLGPARA